MTPKRKRTAERDRKFKSVRELVYDRERGHCLRCGRWTPLHHTEYALAGEANHALGRNYPEFHNDERYVYLLCHQCNRYPDTDTVPVRKMLFAKMAGQYHYDYSDCPDKQYLETK